MFEVLALGFAALVLLALVGALWGLAALVLWIVLLPFRLLALIFKGLAALFFLPFFVLFGIFLAVLIGIPLLLVVLVPALPVLLLVLGIVWLARRGVRHAAPAP